MARGDLRFRFWAVSWQRIKIVVGSFVSLLLTFGGCLFRLTGKLLVGALVVVASIACAIIVLNLLFHTPRGIPYRALAADAPACAAGMKTGWDVLTRTDRDQTPNDEWSAIDVSGAQWRSNFACNIQRHKIAGYVAPDGSTRDLEYNLAFVEFQEDGKPYSLREPCDESRKEADCVDEGFGLVRRSGRNQMDAVLDLLKARGPHYVLVFVHGWRNDASIGNSNVSEFREYAALAARFVEDRWTANPAGTKPDVTAIYIGWRGARTDENWLKRHFGAPGSWLGNFAAVFTLFDRKPVSEAIAPAVLAGLRAIEIQLRIAHKMPRDGSLPAASPNKMIVFGHSLGGNLLISALHDELLKEVGAHKQGAYMQPVLGDLVVLINPAAEAAKWMDLQRAVWNKLAMDLSERRTSDDYESSHFFFAQNQAPIIVSITAARDWPPGGFREADCTSVHLERIDSQKQKENVAVLNEGYDYDWATYDLFPLFKMDFRPVADTIERLSWKADPHNQCDEAKVSLPRKVITYPFVAFSWLLRVLPFMQTNPEQTHTIGNIDPPRAPEGSLSRTYFTGLPFGTTHELRGWPVDTKNPNRKLNKCDYKEDRTCVLREIPIDYDEVISQRGTCPIADEWLIRARQASANADPNGDGIYWDSRSAEEDKPALEFSHGFKGAGIKAITRANDPFWNMRAFDTALARHDGYMLVSFICALNQLVLDDVVGISNGVPAAQHGGH